MTTLNIFNFGEYFREWIKILLGMNSNSGFQAVTIVNRNISKRLNVARGFRQGDPISGYLFILAIEILALSLKKSKAKAYRTKDENKQLLDIYADDLSIYLKYNCNNKISNKNNVLEDLTTIKLFYKWSGLKVNRGKHKLQFSVENFKSPVL